MADNTELNVGSGGDTIASDDIAGVKHQRVKISLGADGAATDALGGAGTVAAGVIRSTLASDDPAVVSLAVIDDWDESDRAKVNPIVGQAGVAGGAGAVGATVQRVTLASDDPAVTALQLLDNAVYVDDADWTDNTSSHVLVGGLYQSTPQTVTDGDVGPFQIDSNGSLKVAIISGAGSGGTAMTDDAAFTVGTTSFTPAGGTYRATPDTVNDGDGGVFAMDQYRALMVTATNGAGVPITPQIDDAAFTAGTSAVSVIAGIASSDTVDVNDAGALAIDVNRNLKVILQANSGVDVGNVDVTSVVPGTGATELGKAEDAVHSSGDVGVMALTVRSNTAAATSGANGDYQPLITDTNGRLHVIEPSAATVAGAVSGTEMQVDVVAALPAGTNTIGVVGLSGAQTTGGTTIFRSIDLDESEEEVKASNGQVYWIHAMNLASSKRYLKFYNATAANVTVGTTTPVLTFALGTQGDTNGAGFVLSVPNGIVFGTAITVAATTGIADNDTGAPGANEVVLNIGYA